MAEVLVVFDAVVAGSAGASYLPRVCGRQRSDGMWEGWIEFEPVVAGTALRTPDETEKHDRADLEYWASGLTATYLEGAFDRAVDLSPSSSRPSPHGRRTTGQSRRASLRHPRRPVLPPKPAPPQPAAARFSTPSTSTLPRARRCCAKS